MPKQRCDCCNTWQKSQQLHPCSHGGERRCKICQLRDAHTPACPAALTTCANSTSSSPYNCSLSPYHQKVEKRALAHHLRQHDHLTFTDITNTHHLPRSFIHRWARNDRHTLNDLSRSGRPPLVDTVTQIAAYIHTQSLRDAAALCDLSKSTIAKTASNNDVIKVEVIHKPALTPLHIEDRLTFCAYHLLLNTNFRSWTFTDEKFFR
jgi:hypothetical protein